MYDPTFHSQTLRRELTYSDQLRDRRLLTEAETDILISASNQRVASGFANVPLVQSTANGSNVYKLKNLADELVLRKIGRNIKRVTNVQQANRTSIIKCLTCLCSEGVPFRVYKVDVRKFYDSVKPDLFLQSITEDTAFPPSTIRLLKSFFDEIERLGIKGLPRGLALSAILGEYIMRRFDGQASKIAGVFFYARFVDDMVFVTKGDEPCKKFLKNINNFLPEGLITNPSKTRYFDFGIFDKNRQTGIEGEFDFLGYVFRISRSRRDSSNRIGRDVQIDISSKKVRRTKTRICIAFQKFLEDMNFENLINRIRMLSANYRLYDDQTGRTRGAGIYHSYHLVGPQVSTSLKDLDVFYQRIILSNKGKICSKLSHVMNSSQKTLLLQYSFERGFYDRLYFSFDAKNVGKLRRCWTDA